MLKSSPLKHKESNMLEVKHNTLTPEQHQARHPNEELPDPNKVMDINEAQQLAFEQSVEKVMTKVDAENEQKINSSKQWVEDNNINLDDIVTNNGVTTYKGKVLDANENPELYYAWLLDSSLETSTSGKILYADKAFEMAKLNSTKEQKQNNASSADAYYTTQVVNEKNAQENPNITYDNAGDYGIETSDGEVFVTPAQITQLNNNELVKKDTDGGSGKRNKDNQMIFPGELHHEMKPGQTAKLFEETKMIFAEQEGINVADVDINDPKFKTLWMQQSEVAMSQYDYNNNTKKAAIKKSKEKKGKYFQTEETSITNDLSYLVDKGIEKGISKKINEEIAIYKEVETNLIEAQEIISVYTDPESEIAKEVKRLMDRNTELINGKYDTDEAIEKANEELNENYKRLHLINNQYTTAYNEYEKALTAYGDFNEEKSEGIAQLVDTQEGLEIYNNEVKKDHGIFSKAKRNLEIGGVNIGIALENAIYKVANSVSFGALDESEFGIARNKITADIRDYANKSADMIGSYDEDAPSWYNAMDRTVNVTAQAAPLIALLALTKNPKLAMTYMGGYYAGDKYFELDQEEIGFKANLMVGSDEFPGLSNLPAHVQEDKAKELLGSFAKMKPEAFNRRFKKLGITYDQVKKYLEGAPNKYSKAMYHALPFLSATIGAASERFTFGQIRALRGLMNRSAKTIGQSGFKGAVNGFKNQLTTKSLIQGGKLTAQEGLTEWGDEVGQDLLIALAQEKDYSLDRLSEVFHGKDQAFVNGMIVNRMLFGLPTVGLKTIQGYRSTKSQNKINDNITRQMEITRLLNGNKVQKIQRSSLMEEMARLQRQNHQILRQDINNFDMFSNKEKTELINIEKKKNELRTSLKEVQLNNVIPKADKQKEIQRLTDEYYKLEDKKEETINVYNNAYQVKKEEKQNTENVKKLNKRIFDDSIEIINATSQENSVELMETSLQERKVAIIEEATRQGRPTKLNSDEKAEINQINDDLAKIEDINKRPEQKSLARGALTAYGYITPRDQAGRQKIILNKKAALKDGFATTAQHEFLHAVMHETLKNDPKVQKAMGEALTGYIGDVTTGNLAETELAKRMRQYVGSGEGVFNEEIMTLLSESMVRENLPFKKERFERIKDFKRRFYQNYLGKDIQFNTGRDVYNFLKDYNNSVKTGNLDKAIGRMAREGASGSLVEDAATRAEQVKMSKAASDNVQRIYNDLGIGGAQDIINEFKPITNKIVDKRRDAPNFDRELLTSEIEIGERGIYDLIQSYDPASGVPLAAYINTYLPSRAIEASRRVLGEEFTDDVTERIDIADEGAEMTYQEDINTRSQIMMSDRLNVTDKLNKAVKKAMNNIDVTKLNYKNTPDIAQKITADLFGISVKKLETGANLTKGELQSSQMFISKNADLLINALPEGATASGTSTGVQNVLLKEFYTKTERAKMSKTGTKAGLPVQVKNNINRNDFLETFGIIDGKPVRDDRNTSARALAMAKQVSRILSNQGIRQELSKTPTEQNIQLMHKLADGKSTIMFSKAVSEDLGVSPIADYLGVNDNKAMEIMGAYGRVSEAQFEILYPDFLEQIKAYENDVMMNAAYDGQQAKQFMKEIKGLDFGNPQTNQYMKTGYHRLSDAKFKDNPAAMEFMTRMSHDLASQMNIPADQVDAVESMLLGFFAGHYAVVGSAPAKVDSPLKKGTVSRLKKQNKNSVLDADILKKLKEFPFDQLKGSYASTFKTAYKRIIAESSVKNKKKIAKEVFNDPSSKLQHDFYELWNSSLESWLHNETPGTQKYNEKLDFILKLKKSNSAIGVTGERILAPSGYIYIPQPGETGRIKFEHFKSSSQQSKESVILIANNKWRETGRDNIQNYKGIYGFTHLFDMVDANTGKVNESGIFRLAKNIDMAKNIFKTDNLDVSLYDEIRQQIGQDAIDMIETNGQGVMFSKALQNKRNTNKDTESRGMSAFDFDETLIDKGDNFIIATKGNQTVRISSGQWPLQGPKLAQEGYKFNFDDFINVRGGVEGPLMQKFRNRIKKYGIENNYILTARPAEAAPAIQAWLKQQGIDMPLENITGLGNSTGEAKAMWMAQKYAEGYNDMYFVDDALPNVEAVKDMMEQLDIKGSSVQAKIKFSQNLSNDFNEILEETTGFKKEQVFSRVKAQKRGAKKGKFKLFIPPSHEDFVGLLYSFLTKGKKGEQQMEWFKKALIKPLNRAYTELNAAKQAIANDYKAIKKKYPEARKKLTKKTPDGDFIFDDAVRVYLWDKFGYEVPGLSQADQKKLANYIKADPNLQAFADGVGMITKQESGYIPPSEYWLTEDIRNDLETATSKIGRAEYFQEFVDNAEVIFSKENLNKIEAIYGSNFREAMEDILYRTTTGNNRNFGKNRLVNQFQDFLNGSIGATMFFNARSAVLQTLSTVNFINWSDNNPLKAAAAFANQPQFWKDFSYIFNSDTLKQRRGGLQQDVNAAELTSYVSKSKNPVRASIKWLLQKGFLPTQIADSFAISTGGSTFYRNRINKYVKEGMSKKAAEEKAWTDFIEISEATQQSARPDMISQQQASPLGRMILAFQNTPSQYARIIKKAALDLANGRGDFKTNVSKIIYYGAAQNLIFMGLQSALFAMLFSDDEEDEEFFAKKQHRVANGMIDSLLRGMGVAGAVVSTIKNMIFKYQEQQGKQFGKDPSAVLVEGLNLSPPIGIKARKIVSAQKTLDYNKEVIKEMETLNIENPVWNAIGNVVEATTNIPLARMHNKIMNLREAMNNENSMWQRVALMLGWNRWDVNVERPQSVKDAKEVVKKKKQTIKNNIKKQEQEIEEQKQIEKNIKKQEEEKEKIEEQNKAKPEKEKKKLQCAAVNKSGQRCKSSVQPGKSFCTVHEKVEQNETGKKSQCKATKSNGKRCKMQTSSKSGYCYYHD